MLKIWLSICVFLVFSINLKVDASCKSAISAEDIADAAELSQKVYELKERSEVLLSAGMGNHINFKV